MQNSPYADPPQPLLQEGQGGYHRRALTRPDDKVMNANRVEGFIQDVLNKIASEKDQIGYG